MVIPKKAKVIIIGGGVIGCSVAYHLGKIGWKDVVLLERKQLTCGTTWHAAGLIAQLRATKNMTRLAKYSQELYQKLEKETIEKQRKKLFLYRLWCIVEMMAAKKHNVPLVVKCGVAVIDGPTVMYDMNGAAQMLSHLACCVNIEDCDSANPKDKIDQLIKVRKMGVVKLENMIETIVACGGNAIHQQVADITDAAVCGEWELLESQSLGPGQAPRHRSGYQQMSAGRNGDQARTGRVLLASSVGGFTSIVKWLISRYRSTVRKFVDEAGCLQLAARYGHAEIVSLLLSVGAALNGVSRNQSNRTSLFLATMHGHTDVVRVLLNKDGINVTKKSGKDAAPFCVACEFGFLEIVQMFLEYELPASDLTLGLLMACQRGHLSRPQRCSRCCFYQSTPSSFPAKGEARCCNCPGAEYGDDYK